MLRQTFGMWDTIVEDVLSSEDATGHGKGNLPNATIGDDNEYDAADDDDLSWDDPKSIDRAAVAEYDRIEEARRIPLFKGSTMTTMETTAIFLKILREGGTSNLLILQVFAAHHRAVLPQPNTLPDSENAASSVL
jgi:hypothetical protein